MSKFMGYAYSTEHLQHKKPSDVQDDIVKLFNKFKTENRGIALKVGSSNMDGKVARGVVFFPKNSYDSIPAPLNGDWTHKHYSQSNYEDLYEEVATFLSYSLTAAQSFWARIVFDNASEHNPNISIYYQKL